MPSVLINILLVEDNPGDVFLVRMAMERIQLPYTLHVADDGAKALSFVADMGKPGHAPCPDLLLLDINLPKVDGPGVLTQFRKHPDCAHTPVIVVTSSGATKDRARMAALGVDGYFCKPPEFEAFMMLGGIVRHAIESRTQVN